MKTSQVSTVLLALLLILQAHPVTAQAELCVNPSGTDGCFASIQAAIDAAPPGASIRVGAGIYLERILISKPLSLSGSGVATTTIEGGAEIESGSLVEVRQVSIRGASAGGLVVDGRSRVTLVDSLVEDNDGECAGVSANGYSRVTLERTSVVGNQGAGLCSTERGRLSIHSSTIAENFGPGLWLRASSSKLENSTVSDPIQLERPAALRVRASIVTAPCTSSQARVTSRGYNVWSVALEQLPCLARLHPKDRHFPQAVLLAPLGYGAGDLPTHALPPRSAAKNVVTHPSLCEEVDQLGNSRGVPCDSGAREAADYLTGIHNPVIDVFGLADPSVIRHEGRYYAYPTGDSRGYDVYVSDDLLTWAQGSRVFDLGGPSAWAPDVFHHEVDDRFYLYYTNQHKIGFASSDSPEGPFLDHGIRRLFAIDAHMFRDDDSQLYLYFAALFPTRIVVQPMRTPLEKQGPEFTVLNLDTPWEGGVIEGPWMVKKRGTYYLMFSGNNASTVDYAVGYATSNSPTGPFTKFAGNPILSTQPGVYGPGHHSVTVGPDGDFVIAYHQKADPTQGWNRYVCLDRLVVTYGSGLWIDPTPFSEASP